MKVPRNPLILVSFLFLFATLAFSSATDVYITSSGSATGACTTNPQSAAFFNSSANWGSGTSQIGPGTTVHLCGTISTALVPQGNGASGNPVTILFESGAKLSASVFPVTGGLNLSKRSWITVDGGTACGPSVTDKTSCNGTIQNTANGTGLSNHTDQTVGIDVDGSSNVTIQNMLVGPIYAHTSSSDLNVPGQPLPSAVWANSATNLTISNSTFHDANWNQSFVSGAASNGLTWTNNDIYNSDHCWAIGVVSQTTTNIQINGNRCHDGGNWDSGSANYYHHDGLHLYTTGGSGKITNVRTYDNTFDGNWGVNNTAAIFEEGPGGGEVDNVIYNNVFLQDNGSFNWNNGYINLGNLSGSNPSVTKLYNNTAIAGSGQHAYMWQLAYAVDMRNNVLVTSDTASGVTLNLAGVTGTIDYNSYANPGGSGGLEINNSAKSFSAWQSAGWDTHSTTANIGTPPFNLSATTGVPAISFVGSNKGVDLTSLDITPLDSDKNGTQRPASGAWDIGAYEMGSSTAQQTAPNPPSGLTATVN